ncbi:unnamed protein product [Prorocentrum cordatum]|uniref:Uncharacterized protein n=1 Tax=Prorocentrum cordatum TaxID=2364126 RepID=A0ABN9PJ67_9DINO|nr:unnamed protein product [Polarella glacialis]
MAALALGHGIRAAECRLDLACDGASVSVRAAPPGMSESAGVVRVGIVSAGVSVGVQVSLEELLAALSALDDAPPAPLALATGPSWGAVAEVAPGSFVAVAGDGDVPEFDPFEQADAAAPLAPGVSPSGALALAEPLAAGGPFAHQLQDPDEELAAAERGGPPRRRALLATLRGHSSTVSAVAWSPDGTRTSRRGKIATGSAAHTTCIWQASGPEAWQWRAVKTLRAPPPRGAPQGEVVEGVTSLAWSPDGARIATGSTDSTARVWRTTDAEMRQWDVEGLLCGHGQGVRAVAWSPKGKRLATASEDRTARVWHVVSGGGWEALAALKGAHADAVCAVAWAPSGRRLATAGADARACVWQAAVRGGSPAWELAATLRSTWPAWRRWPGPPTALGC